MILGFRRNQKDGGLLVVAPNTKSLMKVTVPRRMRVAKLSVKMDGLAPGGIADGQPVRPVIYTAAGGLVGQGDETKVMVGAAEAWIDLRFDTAHPGGLLLEPGEYDMGFIAGAPEAARVRTWLLVGRRSTGADTYATATTQTTAKVTLPAANIPVTSTAALDSAGVAMIAGQEVHYTGKEAAKLTGCSGGSAIIESGTDVTQSGAAVIRNQPEPPKGPRRNLILNPTFEVDVAEWSTSTSVGDFVQTTAFSRVTSWFYPGAGVASAYIKLTKGNTATASAWKLTTPEGTSGMAVVAGLQYAAQARVNILNAAGTGVRIEIRWFKAAGTTISTTEGANVTTTGESLLSLVATAPAEAAFASVRVVAASATANDVVEFEFDAVSFEQSSTVPSYFPTTAQLASGQAVWTGTANKSISALEEGELALFATYFTEGEERPVTDLQVGRYPFSVAQRIFAEAPPELETSQIASCTWHGTRTNPERGSFVLVQREGKFTDLIGERVRISTFRGAAVFAYVLGEVGIEDDISVTRRLFLELGPLASDAVNVRLETLAAVEPS